MHYPPNTDTPNNSEVVAGDNAAGCGGVRPWARRWCSCCSLRRWWWGRAGSGPEEGRPCSGSSRGSSAAERCCSPPHAAPESPCSASDTHTAYNHWSIHYCHTHTHSPSHTHTHVGFYGLRGLSIGVMVVILYKLYVLLPNTYPTPKLSPHRRRCISIFPQKNSLCMIYKRFKLWGHWKCPHKSPSPCNTYVIPMSLYKFVSS